MNRSRGQTRGKARKNVNTDTTKQWNSLMCNTLIKLVRGSCTYRQCRVSPTYGSVGDLRCWMHRDDTGSVRAIDNDKCHRSSKRSRTDTKGNVRYLESYALQLGELYLEALKTIKDLEKNTSGRCESKYNYNDLEPVPQNTEEETVSIIGSIGATNSNKLQPYEKVKDVRDLNES